MTDPTYVRPDDGAAIDWLSFTEHGRPNIEPDRLGALQLMVASAIAMDGDTQHVTGEMDDILRTRSALPLLCGMIFWNMALAKLVFGREELVQRLRYFATVYEVNDIVDTTGEGEDA